MTESGDIYSWGHGKLGALGHSDFSDQAEPKKVEGLSNIKKIDCGSEFTMALDDKGVLYVFGSNSYGQLGITGRTNKINAPQKVFLSRSVGQVQDFTCGEEHAALLDQNGHVHTWGLGIDG